LACRRTRNLDHEWFGFLVDAVRRKNEKYGLNPTRHSDFKSSDIKRDFGYAQCLGRKVRLMIDAGPSHHAAAGLTGAALVSYLVGKGWSARPSRIDGISVFAKNIQGSEQPVEFILPVKPGFVDEQRRIADALRAVAEMEGRSESGIAEDVRQSAGANGLAGQSAGQSGGRATGRRALFKITTLADQGTGAGVEVIEIEVMVDEHGRYEAVIRNAENRDEPVRLRELTSP
jgi:hypothetical protein